MVKWDDKETVRKILIEIWNTVFQDWTEPKDKSADDELNEAEIKALECNIKIAVDQTLKRLNITILLFKLPEGSSAFFEKIYHQLLSSLQQMTVVQFGIEGSDNLFLIPEAKVTTVINEFYRAINS